MKAETAPSLFLPLLSFFSARLRVFAPLRCPRVASSLLARLLLLSAFVLPFAVRGLPVHRRGTIMNLLRPLLAPHLLCAAALCLASVPGARGADKPAAAPAASPAAVAADAPPASAPAATPAPEIAAEVAAHAKTADDLWNYVKKYSGTEDLETIDPSLDQEAKMAKARELIANKVAHLRPAVDELLKKYPKDPHRWDARLMRVFFLKDEDGISDEEADKTFHEIADAPDASPDAKRQARGVLLQTAIEKADPSKGLSDDIEKQLTAYEKDFPDDPVGGQFVALRLKMLQNAPDKIGAELAALARSPNKATAEAATKQLALRTEPLDLKFTALDGKEVDLSKLRGKVVLLDFWATWCGPCMAKLPEILALDKKYKDKDFQLLGISLDQDKEALEKTVKSREMGWPEYFDGKGWQNDLAARFGVEAIPASFLVDKKGRLHPLDGEEDLDAEVGKLLAVDAKP